MESRDFGFDLGAIAIDERDAISDRSQAGQASDIDGKAADAREPTFDPHRCDILQGGTTGMELFREENLFH